MFSPGLCGSYRAPYTFSRGRDPVPSQLKHPLFKVPCKVWVIVPYVWTFPLCKERKNTKDPVSPWTPTPALRTTHPYPATDRFEPMLLPSPNPPSVTVTDRFPAESCTRYHSLGPYYVSTAHEPPITTSPRPTNSMGTNGNAILSFNRGTAARRRVLNPQHVGRYAI